MTKRGDITLALAAVALFLPLFIFRALGPLDFWWWMSANLAALAGLSLVWDGEYPGFVIRDVGSGWAWKTAAGVVSALGLYAIFFLGSRLSPLLSSFAAPDISRIYAFKKGASVVRISLLLIFIIGPGEELFWRGVLQRRFEARFGRYPGYLAAVALYTVIHLGTGNVMLLAAAAVCGAFWGFLYLRYRSVLLVAVSHTVWDLLAFVLFPFRG